MGRPPALAVATLLVALTGCIAAPEPAPPPPAPAIEATAVDTEAAHLERYVLLVCMGAAYGRLDPPPERIVRLLQDEAWVFVEKGRVGPKAYEHLHDLATEAGRGIPPQAAVRGCLAWSERPRVRRRVREEAQRALP